MSDTGAYVLVIIGALLAVPFMLRLLDGCLRIIGALILVGVAVFMFLLLLGALGAAI